MDIYTRTEYFLFKLGLIFSSKIFLLAMALIISLLAFIFFFYDYRTSGPVFRDNSGKNHRINNLKKEVILALLPIVCLVLLFGGRKITSHANNPDQLVLAGKEQQVATGKVVWVQNRTASVGIAIDGRTRKDIIIAKVLNQPVGSDDPVITPYEGTCISNQEFLKLGAGDRVVINARKFEWKYKNHNDFKTSDRIKKQRELLNQAHVNGKVVKIATDASLVEVARDRSSSNQY
ncbi:hypothetical protein [Fructilactobacillus florum]|uniref:hypothetical protein n=1 Tax=Fructilactobacillus florum TaxID=640331 RepID=UPI00058B8164|nr:hypothetical protein [Fructilactobacillus florum]